MINLDSDFNAFYEELDNLNEANKVVNRFNKPWYSGSFSGLNDISNGHTPKSPEQIAQEEEERKKQEKETRIKNAILNKSADTYHYRYQKEILSDPEWPAMDPETRERVYDPARKEELVRQSIAIKQQAYQQSCQKGLETKAAKQAEKNRTYHWVVSYTINKERYRLGKNVLDNENPEATCELLRQAAIKRIKQEKHECTVFKEPFRWDGKITISCKPPKGTEEVIAEYTETI
jgi:hypothetical protein